MKKDFLKKKRLKKNKTLMDIASECHSTPAAISDIETWRSGIGEKRSPLIGKALSIPEDVMTVYSGRLPKYAHKVYREKPDKLEKKIRSAVKKLEKEDE